MEISSKLDLLRTQIESEFPSPALILVTSPDEGDGSGMVAAVLARNLAAAGYSVALASPRTGFSGPQDFHPAGGSRHRVGHIDLENDVSPHANISSIRELVASYKERFDYIIVETGSVVDNSLARAFLDIADSLLVCVRRHRRVLASDSKIAHQLGLNPNLPAKLILLDEGAIKKLKDSFGSKDQSASFPSRRRSEKTLGERQSSTT